MFEAESLTSAAGNRVSEREREGERETPTCFSPGCPAAVGLLSSIPHAEERLKRTPETTATGGGRDAELIRHPLSQTALLGTDSATPLKDVYSVFAVTYIQLLVIIQHLSSSVDIVKKKSAFLSVAKHFYASGHDNGFAFVYCGPQFQGKKKAINMSKGETACMKCRYGIFGDFY